MAQKRMADLRDNATDTWMGATVDSLGKPNPFRAISSNGVTI